MTLGWGNHRRHAPLRPGVPLPDAAAKAFAEVARRLDRDLTLSTATFSGSGVAVYARDVSDGAAGPVAHAWLDSPGLVSVELRCPPGDPWERAAPAVAEMHAELLGGVLTDPEADLAGLDALSAATKAAVHARTDVDHGPYRSIPAQIRAIARSTPDTVAVYAADGTLTYARFVGHADALAARIRSVTTEPGRLLPVLVADGRVLPVSWAAVMIAGAGYVPVDPHWPAARIAQVLDLLDAPVVLCADIAVIPAAHRDRALVVDLGEYDVLDDPPDPGPDDVVYGVYTSGTTGTPLCAVNLHRGLTNRLAFMNRWFGEPATREVVLQNTRHTFDSAFWQLFWPLTTGGATVVPSAGDHHDLRHTIDLIEAHEVTVTDFVPAVLSALLTLLRQRPATAGRLRSLRHLVVGGEQINPLDVHRLRELLPGLRVSNAYGPTEASIGMIFHEVTARDGDVVPLGRPIDNCAAVVVDVDVRPLPPGVTGEIVIGGACVGAGYHGEPRRTAERFFTSPTSGRMYRTGDLGHVDAEGRFHFGGRIDHQLKIDGVRVEPGEIETAALSCAGVLRAVALAVAGEPVLAVTGTASASQVLAQLRDRLPRGSMPRRAVAVGELPLTAAGKIDRRALAAMVERPATPPDSGADPVLAVLRNALRRPDLGVDEDFFAAGANSLQAVAAVVELSDRFGVDVGVRDLADRPTAAGLRDLIGRRDRVPVSSELVTADLASLSTTRTPLRDKRDRTACTVLLTGATGFVGARLLHELLESTGLTVRCLVRGHDDAHARHRVLTALAAQRLECDTARITVVAGDLARPGFGLTAPRWRSLAEECDLVVHAGALVNLLYDYRMHREPNVLGTAEVIRFARAAGGIPLHYISTLGALYDHALTSGHVVTEDVDLEGVTPPSSGYSLSKWAGERLVTAAADLPVSVLRLGEVMPATDVAVPNPAALTHLLLTAFERLGSVPNARIRSDYSPVDTVARIVVEAVQDPAVLGRALHVYSPGTVRFDELAVGADRVSCLDFLGLLRASADVEPGLLLAIIEHRADGRTADETAVREVLENLLQDNPALFTTSATRPKEPASA
ncbi:non-ribosomal peptide synthetase [Amycolatopsis sp. cmx-4-54]|uniref:non-ribosomal peptide synthetase n=1 Tax=Amycolatopsis sp. cmx-4-54 TaxID=2790936 RepID=UPI0039794BC0